MADWNTPTLGSSYTNFLSEVKDRDVDIAKQFDGTTSTNLPTNAIRWDSSANRWKKWNGSSWAELTSAYNFNNAQINSNQILHASNYNSYAPTLTGTGASGTWGISITGNAANITGTYAGTISSSQVTTGLGFTPLQQGGGLGQGTNKLYIGWLGSNLGLQVDSTNFSNTWPISISGNAATATSATSAGSSTSASYAGYVTSSLTLSDAGSGSSSGTTFNGSVARTISYNSVGAPSTTGVNASGTWGIAITGNAATATKLSTASGSAPSYSARAWGCVQGDLAVGAAALLAGANMTVSRTATGTYLVQFTTGMEDTNYSINISGARSTGGQMSRVDPASIGTGGFSFVMLDGSAAANNPPRIYITVYR